MRTKWLTTMAAALCAAGLHVEPVAAGPAGMSVAMRQPVATTPAPAPSATSAQAPVRIAEAPPSQSISPLRNPVKYFSATIAEMPRPSLPRPSLPRPSFWKSKDSDAVAEEAVPPTSPTAETVSTTSSAPSPHVLISLAQACEQQGAIDQARGHYQQALAQWPGQVDVLRAAARMEDRLGQFPQAEMLYRQAVANNPQHPGALNDLGLCLARQGKLDQSIQALEQAIQLQPDKALYRNNAATVLVEVRQDQRALAHLAAVHSPPQAQYNMGQLLVARGRAADASRYFQTALAEDPQMEAAASALSQLTASQAPALQLPEQSANRPPIAVEQPLPMNMPAAGPQYTPQYGPQISYPSEARTPDQGRSTYVPPAYQMPSGPVQTPAVPAGQSPSAPWVSQATPRYLPPVNAAPAAMRR